MPITTRTIGPIHFEDLNPSRFEDLVRQLLYDFRDWQQLETTGRSGSDDGFDARGWERVQPSEPSLREDGEEPIDPDVEQRQWLIQCKREKSIGPKKLIQYLEEIPEDERHNLHGVVFVAACDFSKKARDGFRDKLREFGVAEVYLWGKGEVEDLLFQPKNDHLLFAYFGISLRARRRSLRTTVRSKLAMKRTLFRKLDRLDYVVVRDATDDRFPYLDPDETKDRFDRGRWRVWQVHDLCEDGLRLLIRRHFAFLSNDGTNWDYAETMNDARPHRHIDQWDGGERADVERGKAMKIWDSLNEFEKGWYVVVHSIPYERILDVDDVEPFQYAGDHLKQVYVDRFDQQHGPFQPYYWQYLSHIDQYHQGKLPEPTADNRVKVFERSDPRP